jgi:hypothetical protein
MNFLKKIVISLKINYMNNEDFLIEICKNEKNKLFILMNYQIYKKEETKRLYKIVLIFNYI